MSRFRDPLVFGLVFLCCFVFYAAGNKDVRDHNWLDRAVLLVTAPVQSVIVGAIDGVGGLWHDYVYLVGAREENHVLKEEVRRLRRELAGQPEQVFENQRLRALLDMRRRAPRARYSVADVISISPSPLFRSIRISLGRVDGVNLGAAVINERGVVGRVAGVADYYADVILLVDVNHSTDVLVQRTRSRARVRGMGDDTEAGIEVERLTRTAEVEPGDLLVTSGVGGVYPRGIPIGKVTSVEKKEFGLYQSVTLEPSVDFSEIETVLVLMEYRESHETPSLEPTSGLIEGP